MNVSFISVLVNTASVSILCELISVWFLFFNGISTFVGYLIPKPFF